MSGLVALSRAMRLSSTSAMFLSATSRTKSSSLFRFAPAPPVPTAPERPAGCSDEGGFVPSVFEQPLMTMVMAASATHNSPVRLIGSSLHHRPGLFPSRSPCKRSDVSGIQCRVNLTHNHPPIRSRRIREFLKAWSRPHTLPLVAFRSRGGTRDSRPGKDSARIRPIASGRAVSAYRGVRSTKAYRLCCRWPDNTFLGPDLQPDLHHARHDDDVPLRRAGHAGARYLFRSRDVTDRDVEVAKRIFSSTERAHSHWRKGRTASLSVRSTNPELHHQHASVRFVRRRKSVLFIRSRDGSGDTVYLHIQVPSRAEGRSGLSLLSSSVLTSRASPLTTSRVYPSCALSLLTLRRE